jgi:tetratricopeptide (TPR) repeat protein
MRFIPPIELDPRLIADPGNDPDQAAPADRLIELTSWMLVLGTIRLTCALADYAGTFLDDWRSQPFTLRAMSSLTAENQPIIVLCTAWPLFLCIALRRTRWGELIPAAAATFLILSIGGAIEFCAEWSQTRASEVTIGSFHLTRRAFARPTLSDVSLVTLGAIQLLLELTAAARAALLIPAFRGIHSVVCPKNEEARRARFGRLAVYASIGFLVLMVRPPVWSTYLELLDSSATIRQFILRNDIERLAGPRRNVQLTEEQQREHRMRILLMAANDAAMTDRFQTAEETYLELIALADPDDYDSLKAGDRNIVAQSLNGLAWLESTCADPARRRPAQAVRHARRAIELLPADGNIWNTLGVAYYRAGNWTEAKSALARSMDLRRGGDSFDWFFLGLVELKLGDREQALAWHEKAVARFHGTVPADRELYRFHVEAAEALELPRPAPPAPRPSIRAGPTTLFPIGSSFESRRKHSMIDGPLPRTAAPDEKRRRN